MPYSPEARAARLCRFEDIAVGDEAELSHVLSENDVRAFAELTGDYNPLHVNPDFARRTLYRKPVVHGMLSASFISTMIGMLLPGGGALWTSQTLEFLRPAFAGDELRVHASVRQKSVATRMLVLGTVVENQRGERVIAGEATVRLLDSVDEIGAAHVTGGGVTDRPPEEPAAVAADTRAAASTNAVAGKDGRAVVLLTGGSRGIGAATSLRLAREGFAVAVNYESNAAAAGEVVSAIEEGGGRAAAVGGDVSDPAQVMQVMAEVAERLGPVRYLVHCAAAGSALKPFADLPWEAFQRQLDVQLRGAYNCLQLALPDMLAAGDGAVVLLGSTASDDSPPPHQSDYVVAKAALSAMARALAVECGPRGVRVNVVAPGMTKTDMIAYISDKAKILAKMQTPLRRLAEPEDVAAAIAFLLSPAARHITGETLRVCGGAVMM